jgi:hypothetical protein
MPEYPTLHGIPDAPLQGRPVSPDFSIRAMVEQEGFEPASAPTNKGQHCWFHVGAGGFFGFWVCVTPWLLASGNGALELQFCNRRHGKPFYEITIGVERAALAFFARGLAGLVFPGENLKSLMQKSVVKE